MAMIKRNCDYAGVGDVVVVRVAPPNLGKRINPDITRNGSP